MADIFHQVGIKADTSVTYTALTTLEGLSNWWTDTSGDTGEGGTLVFHFDEHAVEMTIVELQPNKKIRWKCTVKSGEWKDTFVTFELAETTDQVFINFSHTNWTAQTELCSHCSTKWAVFLLSLKDYLEKGKGKPFPDDIHINHNDF